MAHHVELSAATAVVAHDGENLRENQKDPLALGRGACSRFHPSFVSPACGRPKRSGAPVTGRFRGRLVDLETKEAVPRQAHRWFSPAPCRGTCTNSRSLRAGWPGYSSGSTPTVYEREYSRRIYPRG